VACHQAKPKRELIRIVRTTSGEVVIDSIGKKSGRGAYLCRIPSCWESAIKKKSLEYALRTHLSPEAVAMIHEYASGLKEVENQPDR